jgi:hypothetical protein
MFGHAAAVKPTRITDEIAAWSAPANGFQPRSKPRVHLAARKIHASRRSGKPQTPTATPRSRVSDCGRCTRFAAAEVATRPSQSGSEGPPVAANTSGQPKRTGGPHQLTARISRRCPRVLVAAARPRPGLRNDGGKPVGSPVLRLWNESRTNRARIADSIPIGFRSRPHIVGGGSATTKSCNRLTRLPP